VHLVQRFTCEFHPLVELDPLGGKVAPQEFLEAMVRIPEVLGTSVPLLKERIERYDDYVVSR